MSSYGKRKGSSWETAICAYLIERGWPYAERRHLAGAADKGDIAGIPGVVIEAKNTKEIKLSAAVDEAETEAANASAIYGFAWIKRSRKPSPAHGYVVMTGDTFTRLLKEAGY